MNFEIKDRDAAGRICRFTTKNGIVTTPVLLPVINPRKLLISPDEMKKLFGVEMVITNSYIIWKDSELRARALEEGIHRLLEYSGPIMTDSGTFQSYVYGDINIDPIEIVKFQEEIKSDVGTILDVFGVPDQTKKQARESVFETIKRAKKAMKVKKQMALACTIQGSVYPDLRLKCARELSKLEADFFPIGGVVPLMENQRYSDLIRCIIAAKQGIDPSKPVHLFGAGHPLMFPLAVALGCDFFDSSAYAKFAIDRRMMFTWGTEKLENLTELPCCCPACKDFSIAELKNLEKDYLTLHLAKHNLYISFMELKQIRNAIAQGNLWELVERKASLNPYLLEALRELENPKCKEWLEKFEPISKKKALLYTGNHTIHRPLLYRWHNKLLYRYTPSGTIIVVVPESKKPYSKYLTQKIMSICNNESVDVVVHSNLGPVPISLDEMYPFAQAIFPAIIDKETKESTQKIFESFCRKYTQVIKWRDDTSLKELHLLKEKKLDLDLAKIAAVANMQFSNNASKALFNGKVRINKSKKTGKIRTVFLNERHILSMRANDGLFTLKKEGAKLLHSFFRYPQMRVVVNNEAKPYIKKGKSVFAKFVVECDPELRPFDECLIVDGEDELLAIGKTLLNRIEMLSFNYGIAVKTRERI